LAARSNRLLALSTATFLPAPWRPTIRRACAALGVAITAVLCGAGFELAAIDREYGDVAAWSLPVWLFTAIMPVGFALLALRLVWHGGESAGERALVAVGAAVALALLALPFVFRLGPFAILFAAA
ncbi:MAG: Tripartite ATP-independent periplasmic transporter, DctQ component, partial [Actinomycetota bacterium]